jgi:two-component system phosphate regulon sensor histidine kinase PhoR
MIPRLHYRFLLWNLGVIAVTVLLFDFLLNSTLRAFLREQVESRLRHESALVSAYLTGGKNQASDRETDRIAELLDVRVTVIAPDGRVVGDSELQEPELAAVENHRGRPEVVAAGKNGFGSSVRFSATTHTNYMYTAMVAPFGFIRLAMPLTQVDELRAELRSRLAYVSLVAIALTMLLSYVVALRMSRPIRDIAVAANRLAAGNLNATLPVKGSAEIAALAGAFNTMAANLSTKIRELSEGKQRLELILSAMSEGIMVLDGKGRVGLMNRAIEELLGSRRSIVGEVPVQLLGHEAFGRAVHQALEDNRAGTVEFTTGAGRVLQAHLAPIAGADGRTEAVVIVFHNLTEIRRIEQMRRDFVANVSHEFKTPLTSIRGYTETLLSGAGEEPELRNDFLRVIERNARLLESLVRDLLTLARLEAELPAAMELVDVKAIVQEHLSARQTSLSERGIRVKIDCPPVSLRADASRLAAAISNLIDNAISYNRAGGEIRITGKAEQGRLLSLAISDTGSGIPAGELSRIFERFYRIDRARSRESGGTGLGLSIAKHAVESQGGRITVESTPGAGSTFTIHFSA